MNQKRKRLSSLKEMEALIAHTTLSRESLREELDLHSTFQWEHFLHGGVDGHFVAREELFDSTDQLVDASMYWKQVEYKYPFYGTLTLPKDRVSVAVYTRRAFDYPNLIVWVKLPNLTLVGNETAIHYYIGLEHGSLFFNGIACFMLTTDTTVTNQLKGFIGPLDIETTVVIDVNKPADFQTAYHTYRVLHSRNLTMFTIDGKPALFAIPSESGSAVKVKENVLPYSIVLTNPLPKSLTAFHEIQTNRTSTASSDILVPTSPFSFRVSDGNETIPLRLPLYEEDTSNLFADKSVSAGTLVSHPVPVFGYKNKIFNFLAGVAGTLAIGGYTRSGDWRTYDSLSYTANNFFKYIMTGDAVLARLSYTPSTYPASVSEGEVVLDG